MIVATFNAVRYPPGRKPYAGHMTDIRHYV